MTIPHTVWLRSFSYDERPSSENFVTIAKHPRAWSERNRSGALATQPPFEETRGAIERWLQRLGLGTEIAVIVLMGGDEADLFPEPRCGPYWNAGQIC
jgi:hypothetical protein